MLNVSNVLKFPLCMRGRTIFVRKVLPTIRLDNRGKMIIQNTKEIVFEKDNMRIREYITKDLTENFSLAIVTLKGEHPTTRNTASDRAYFIVQGEASVTVGNETGRVKVGDVVFIPKGMIHSIQGDVVYAVINSPAFNPSDEVRP